MKIPLQIHLPLWYIKDEETGEITIDREEMVDSLERAMGELEDRLNAKLLAK